MTHKNGANNIKLLKLTGLRSCFKKEKTVCPTVYTYICPKIYNNIML